MDRDSQAARDEGEPGWEGRGADRSRKKATELGATRLAGWALWRRPEGPQGNIGFAVPCRLDLAGAFQGPVEQITQILGRVAEGDSKASDDLMSLVYGELRRIAGSKMAKESAGDTLQATALVHEAWLRLGGDEQPTWENRRHFFHAAAEAMRRILIDRARQRAAERHGGGQKRIDLGEVEIAGVQSSDEVLAVDEALERLALEDPRKAELVRLRYFVGMQLKDAAQVMGISLATATRSWSYSRAWLAREIRAGRK